MPLWEKNNNFNEWCNINDFEIISTAYWHEVNLFLKVVVVYFPKNSKENEEEEFEPWTNGGLKLQVSRARFREPGHHWESLSK